MAQYIRRNAWNDNGTFDNSDLLWYARGVAEMQARPLNDLSSWWFFAAIHGEYLTETSFPGWGSLPAPPNVPTSPVPSGDVQGVYWNQCQHQSWYFAPWHRGYLLALEAQVRKAIADLGGPSDWALPYWNYLGPGSENRIPPAFTQTDLPDGSPNSLFVTARYGPRGDGDVFVRRSVVNQDCLSNTLYTGTNPATTPPGFGGPETRFWHGGGTSGNLESNPHNLVHTEVGGFLSNGTSGLMSDPGLAGLDPIFYLHHANIDRLWAVWNEALNQTNPTDSSWLDGPTGQGQRQFVMPWPNGAPYEYTPRDVNSLSQLNYTYEDLAATTIVTPPAAQLAARLSRLGVSVTEPEVEDLAAKAGGTIEMMGANRRPVQIEAGMEHTLVELDSSVRRKMTASLTTAAEARQPDRVFLYLEDIRGTQDATVLDVYVDLPEGVDPADRPEKLIGSVSLFGLRRASMEDGQHGGGGLSFALDITQAMDAMHLEDTLGSDEIGVSLVPNRPVPEPVVVGRVSIFRQEA